MRKKIQLNQWQFLQLNRKPPCWMSVQIPHTWNAYDGQDGGADYQRITCVYKTTFERPQAKKVYICFDGVNHLARVCCNGKDLGLHRGGYAAFNFELTKALQDGENELMVYVSNEPDGMTYPFMADYTFFGGIYRQVYLLAFDNAHFSMDEAGSCGVFVTPTIDGKVHVEAYTVGGAMLHASVSDPQKATVASATAPVQGELTVLDLQVDSPRLWEGKKSPVLYELHLALDDADKLVIPIGFRSVSTSAEEGFLLNGKPYQLHGVAKHQDREDMGWAIGDREQREDMDIICEMGANSVRLSHYQHASYVYDLCDERGMVAWAEIPLISEYMDTKEADENILHQLEELICQLYNHPSVCLWCIANEINIGGVNDHLIALLKCLEGRVKVLDVSRPTVMANIGATEVQSPLWQITDAVTVNKYLGWYEGDKEEFGPLLDRLHAALPGRPLGLSEYGADAVLMWHSDAPRCMDYTEEYQALLHECAWDALSQRSWLLGVWLWNMFDFAADHREEGGTRGRNHKGLVTFDRKIRKDAFWYYKACWSDEPFVYITGKRFTRRAGESLDVKVYSNQPEVTLKSGEQEWTLQGQHVFIFKDVPLTGDGITLCAVAGACTDTLDIEHIAQPDPSYVLPQPKVEIDARVRQWFADIQQPPKVIERVEGCFTMNDLMDDIVKCPEAMDAVETYWATPLDISGPGLAERLRKGGSMPPAHIWRFVKNKLPEAAYALLDAALAKVQRPAN